MAQADKAVAIEFIKHISGLDVSNWRVRSSDGHIKFSIEEASDNLPEPSSPDELYLNWKISKSLGVSPDQYYDNGVAYSWDLSNSRSVFFESKDWDEVSIGLIDFKSE